MPISRDKAIGFAADRLAKKEPPEDVISKLSNYGNLTWEESERIVNEVQNKRPGAVARRRLFGTLIIGGLMLVVGLYLIMLNGQLLIDTFGITPPLYENYRGTALPVYGRIYAGKDALQFYAGLGLAVLGALQMVLAVVASLRP